MKLGNLLEMPIRIYEKRSKIPGSIFRNYIFLRKKLDANWPKEFDIEKYIYVNSIVDEEIKFSKSLPPIEILIVVKPEDFKLLEKVVQNSIIATKNPISKIILIVPDLDINAMLSKEFLREEHGISIIVEPESKYITDEETSLIRENLPKRFGWILQQILVARYVLKSAAKGVLVIDADTILLKSRVWLDDFKNQVLIPTQEFNYPYYDFLQNISSIYSDNQQSFVSHHMLMQPIILREIHDSIGITITDLLRRALNYAYQIQSNSPFDLKYEPYAQYLIKQYRSNVKLAKWANLSISRKEFHKMSPSHLNKLKYTYSSLSVHHWNK